MTPDLDSTDVLSHVTSLGVVPVAVVEERACAEPLAAALKAGGVPWVELTLRTPAAAGVLRLLREDPDLVVGAGTVTNCQQLDVAMDAGAQFVVSPGFSPAVVKACQAVGVPVVPGVSTATEIMMALDAGLTVVKFFPAEASGGVTALKALSAPFPHVQFMPTGGITLTNLADYLEHDAVLAVGGTWMVAPSLLKEGRFDEVERLTSEAAAAARACKPLAKT